MVNKKIPEVRTYVLTCPHCGGVIEIVLNKKNEPMFVVNNNDNNER